jgi:alpha/beta superfamily hydrolase
MVFSIEFLVKNYQNKYIVSTKRVTITAEESLEAVLHEGAGKGGVVICHPHPLYGGSMHNSVVEAVEDGFYRAGFTTLRFNFRGVGGSTGRYADGVGETADVLAACAFLDEKIEKDQMFVLAGYSFGAWVSTMAMARIGRHVDLFLVAYPFSAHAPPDLASFQGIVALIGGSRDDISPVDDLLSFHKGLVCAKRLKIFPSSHFFDGCEKDISDFVVDIFGENEG